VVWLAFEEFGGGRALLSVFIGRRRVVLFGFVGDRLGWTFHHFSKYN
jgi:hypothetical protein